MLLKVRYPMGDGEGDLLWRAQSQRYSYVIDAETDRYGVTDPELQLLWYPVLKRTPCGAWIIDGYGQKKFVKLTAHKRFACNTREEAIASFTARKKRQIAILEAQLDRARKDLALATTKEGILH